MSDLKPKMRPVQRVEEVKAPTVQTPTVVHLERIIEKAKDAPAGWRFEVERDEQDLITAIIARPM